MRRGVAGTAGLLMSVGLLAACGGRPYYPGVTFVAPSEQASEQLHLTCEYLDVVPTGTHMDAGAAAVQRGGNVVMPLGGVTNETSARTVTTGRNYVLETQSWTWAGTNTVAIFRCGAAPIPEQRAHR